MRVTDSWTPIPELQSLTRKLTPSSESSAAMAIPRWAYLIPRGACATNLGPGQINAGSLIWSALTTARGKPDSPLKILIVGTLAPAATGPGHFFFDLIDKGSVGDTHVTALRGKLDTWDSWATIRKANPLMSRYADSRKQLLKERDAARLDTRLRAEFLSYRLNLPITG